MTTASIWGGGTATPVSLSGIDLTTIADYTELRNYSGSDTTLYVRQAGIAGFFTVDTADVASADNSGTVIVGTAGKRWKRVFTGALDPKWFGAKGDGVTNDAVVIQSVIDLLDKITGGAIYLEGKFYCGSTTIFVRRPAHIFGKSDGATTFVPFFTPSGELLFDGTSVGVWIQRSNESADGGAGDGAFLENLGVRSLSAAVGYNFGIRMTATATCRNVAANTWSGNGFHLEATAPANNANRWKLEDCRGRGNGGHGLFVNGADTNAGVCIGGDFSANGGWGIYDSSFLGNTYIGCHTNGNTLGPYFTDNTNAANHFSGCYSESNQPPSRFATRTTYAGGLHAAGLVGGKRVGDITDASENRSAILYADRTAAGAGYTSAPVVTFDAPTGTAATATATQVGGVITKITITGAGSGYGSDPVVTITDSAGPGAGATAEAHISAPFFGTAGAVRSITVLNGGAGYVTPTVTIAAPVNTTATGTAVLDTTGGVSHIVVTNPGSGYTVDPAITLTGGAGAGAAFTAVRATNFNGAVTVGGAISNGDVLKWVFDNINGTAIQTYRLRFINNNTGDLTLDVNNGGTARWFEATGTFTQQTFGRTNTVPRVMFFSKGVFVGAGRMISTEATIPPTSGQYARGDVIFARDPVAGGSPGVVCTTTGTAGSTAVFKAMANIAP